MTLRVLPILFLPFSLEVAVVAVKEHPLALEVVGVQVPSFGVWFQPEIPALLVKAGGVTAMVRLLDTLLSLLGEAGQEMNLQMEFLALSALREGEVVPTLRQEER